MIDSSVVEFLKSKKNLLAFSAGIDSTALFFLLLENNIEFDIAIVDYNQRAQSKEEVAYAQMLCETHGKKCFLSSYEKQSFSEKDARDFRYDFFEKLIKEHSYDTLLTAHQLNDQLEWFMMQLGKGSGLVELLGMQTFTQKNSYTLVRPLLQVSKDELLEYLEKNDIKYFVDESNIDTKYKRNQIRKDFTNEFLLQYKEGVKKSFEYLNKDQQTLMGKTRKILEIKEFSLYVFTNMNSAIRVIDKECKQRGILLSSSTRDEILSQKQIVVSHRLAIAFESNRIYIAPYCRATMPKEFKELCRLNNIPQNIRAYLFEAQINIDEIVK